MAENTSDRSHCSRRYHNQTPAYSLRIRLLSRLHPPSASVLPRLLAYVLHTPHYNLHLPHHRGILMCLPRAAYGKYHTFHTGSRQNLPAGQKWKLHARHLKNRYPWQPSGFPFRSETSHWYNQQNLKILIAKRSPQTGSQPQIESRSALQESLPTLLR